MGRAVVEDRAGGWRAVLLVGPSVDALDTRGMTREAGGEDEVAGAD